MPAQQILAWIRHQWWPLCLAAIILVTIVSRIPLRFQVPFNWDSVDYILALEDFDLARQQPHPPGNPLYVLLGRLAHVLVADPNQALIAISIVSSLIAVWGVAQLGARLASRRVGLWAAVLLAFNPMFWLHGEVALPYTVEAAAATVLALAAWSSYQNPGTVRAIALGLTYACAGGLRPTLLPLLFLVFAFGLSRLAWRQRLVAVGTCAATCLAWLVPLVVLAGGVDSYRELSRAQATIAGGDTALIGGAATGWARNLTFFGVTLAAASNVLPIAALVSLVRNRPGLKAVSPHSVLLWLWILPPVAVFSLIHFGQIGYVLLIVPPVILLTLIQLERAWPDAMRLRRPALWMVVLLAGSVLVVAPMVSFARLENATWEAINRQVSALPPSETVVLAQVSDDGSYRLAGYLFPSYRVLGLDGTEASTWGMWFETVDGQSTVRLDEAFQTCSRVPIPGARYLVALDDLIAQRVPDAASWRRIDLPNGNRMLVREIAAGNTALDFTDGTLRVSVTPPGTRLVPECSPA